MDNPPPTLRCRECGTTAPPEGPQYCEACFGPVEVVLSPPEREAAQLRDAVAGGPETAARWATLLPAGMELSGAIGGGTPLRPAPALGAALGLSDLWIKDETANPTGSFKDRVVDVAVARAVATGAEVVACSSTGNLARAVVASAAARGLAAVVVVPAELPDAEVGDLVAHGGHVVRVDGPYDAASRLTAEAAAELDGWGWVNVTLRPWYELGARTLGWEVVSDSGWTSPDRVVVPMASGALACAVADGIAQLTGWGLAGGAEPRLTVAQPAGCAPVAAAFTEGRTVVRPVRPDTVAHSLAMGDPPDGDAVLAAVRRTGGDVVAVDEGAIAGHVHRLRQLGGVDAEPAGGVALGALAEVVAAGRIGPDERVVLVVTGAAEPRWPTQVVPRTGATYTIEPAVGALLSALPPDIVRN